MQLQLYFPGDAPEEDVLAFNSRTPFWITNEPQESYIVIRGVRGGTSTGKTWCLGSHFCHKNVPTATLNKA
jgi:hypothetical protein